MNDKLIVSNERVKMLTKEMIRQLGLYHEKYQLNQSDIARELGLTTATVSRLATGVCCPSTAVFLSIYRLYCSMDMVVKRHDYGLNCIRL